MRLMVNDRPVALRFKHTLFTFPQPIKVKRYGKVKTRMVRGQTLITFSIGNKKIAKAFSWCSEQDLWNYETGRRTALRHLLEGDLYWLQREEREQIWRQYHDAIANGAKRREDREATLANGFKETDDGPDESAGEKAGDTSEVGDTKAEAPPVSGAEAGSGVSAQQAEQDSPAQWRYRC